MNEKTELIGILGLGFLGKELAALTSWEEGSWGSWHSSPIPLCPLEQFHFDWEEVSSWSRIPEKSAVMILIDLFGFSISICHIVIQCHF